jgi:6-phosphogluconolactonase (cycloisomerase 2 family)
VICTPNPYVVGGSVTGLLSGNRAGLTNNGSNGITVLANGTFTFSPPSPSGSAYSVTVSQQPMSQSCSVTNGVGSLAGDNASNIAVICSSLNYTVTANVFGLLPNTNLQLQDNGGDNLAVPAIGAYIFKTSIPTRGSYAVTVLTQLSGQICFTTNGSGTVANSNVTVTIVCPWHVAYVTNGATSFYYIDPTTGALLPGSSTATAGAFVAIAPNGKFAYVANENGISVYSVDAATGMLTSAGSSVSAATNNPVTIAIDPSGQFLYAGNAGYVNLGQGPQNISGFTISATTGGLTSITSTLLAGILSPASMVVDPSGKFLLASNGVYAIDRSTGGLTIVPGSTGFGGLGPTSSALDSHGSFVYSVGSLSSGAFSFNAGTGQFDGHRGKHSVAIERHLDCPHARRSLCLYSECRRRKRHCRPGV